MQPITPGADVNMMSVSYDEHGQHPQPVAHACEECGDTWHRGSPLDSGGARYLINGRWLCSECRCK